MTYRFSCAVRLSAPDTEWDGKLMPIAGLVTPPVEASTPTLAIHDPITVQYCLDNKCTVYRVVR